MRRFFLSLVSLVAAFSIFVSTVYGQAPPSATAQEGTKVPAFQFTVAFLSFLLLMVVVCAPSRKN